MINSSKSIMLFLRMNDAILFQIIKGLQSYKNASDNRWALEIQQQPPLPLDDFLKSSIIF